MVIELGVDGFISFQAKLAPERLILVVASGDLQRLGENQEPLEPSGMYPYQDQMRGHTPQFCLHPYEPAPEATEGVTTWTWFSDTMNGFWSIDLIHHPDDTWGCGISHHEVSEESEESEEDGDMREVFSTWFGLPDFISEHVTAKPASVVRLHKKHGHTIN
jgi:hypothetical protein